MPQASLQLNHLNIPARDPDGLAKWYADTFGLRHDGNKARSEDVLLVFQKGEPVNRAPELHMGLRVPSMATLKEWQAKLGGEIFNGAEFAAFKVSDPEGNCIELYAPIGS
ncbi:MAG TPA: VOC family protein [Burkholderiales bacterium]|nr:VOC family protein [Burkholderiales bacterium]